MSNLTTENAPSKWTQRLWQWLTSLTTKWTEKDGVVYFTVTSDGTTGENWITRLESKGFSMSDAAQYLLRSPEFKPTSGVTTEVAVLKGMLFEDNDRRTKKILGEADKRKLQKPNAELACLIRLKFTDKEIEQMGLWCIVAMHEPISDSDGLPCLLSANRYEYGKWLRASDGSLGRRWNREHGFACVVPQK